MRILAPICLAALASLSASPALADDPQGWGDFNIGINLGDGWRASSQTELRTSDARGFYEIEQNTMLGKKLDQHVTLWLGHTLDLNYQHGDFAVTEHRFRQQVNVDTITRLGPFAINGRLRLEERWRDGQAGTGWRFRPALKASAPLFGKTRLVLGHESFFALNTTAFQRTAGYERMRNSVITSTSLAKTLLVELGYLNQHTFVRRGPDTDDHALVVGFTANF